MATSSTSRPDPDLSVKDHKDQGVVEDQMPPAAKACSKPHGRDKGIDVPATPGFEVCKNKGSRNL